MELTNEQSEQLKKMIKDWTKDKRFELETTFGISENRRERRISYVVDSNTFLLIAKRLRTKGFEIIP